MLESEQYEPWLNANSGYWSQPLNAYRDAAVWSGDPKVALFKDAMQSQFYTGYKGPISQASGAVNADYVLVQMLRVGRDRRSDAGSGRRRSRAPRQALLSPRGLEPNHGVMPGLVPGIHALAAMKDVDGRDKPGHDERKDVDAG